MQKLWTIQDWQTAYQNHHIQLNDLYAYCQTLPNDDHAWISIANDAQLKIQIDALAGQEHLPLYGIPFAVKDNIDVAGFYTTAACQEAAYLAQQDAHVVAKLKSAGAIVIGKTNLDQFATGLVGVRSPYGAVKNSFNPDYISGGSSSGSSVAVARGQVPFSLGTDTAGSGRVPAGHNNIVGLKPTKGWFSNTGLIPACRSIDVISIFALTVDDAWYVANYMQGYDSEDPYSRCHPKNVAQQFSKGKIAIPKQLEFHGDLQSEHAFNVAIERVKQLGYEIESIDFGIFNQLATALYNKAWVAERDHAVKQHVERNTLHPIIAHITRQADQFSALDLIEAEYERAHLARLIQIALQEFDALMVPTAPTIYTIEDVEADPLIKNSHMGTYTNFVNFADLSALALPNCIRDDGLPSGVTFIAPAWMDEALAQFGQRWQSTTHLYLGTSDHYYQKTNSIDSSNLIEIAVVGAHLTGMPLNFQLRTRSATLKQVTKTAPHYALFALPNTSPPKPALAYRHSDGHAIEVEVWQIPLAYFGAFVAEVPAPLGIGNVQLQDGRWVKGFICEGYALNDATDISEFGGWRSYLEHLAMPKTQHAELML